MEELNNGDVYWDERAESHFVVGDRYDFWLPYDDNEFFAPRSKSHGYDGCVYQGTFWEVFELIAGHTGEKVEGLDEC